MDRRNDSLPWLIKMIAILSMATFFLIMGISMLISAYLLDNPLEFIMAFFSSCLMVLISLVGLIYASIRIYQRWVIYFKSPTNVS